MNRLTISILFFFVLNVINAQYDHISIEKDLQGDALLSKLSSDYKTQTVYDYSEARDTLYKAIYREDGSVEGIYTGVKVSLPDGVDPSTFIFMNSADYGINAEHSYPQSMGASSGNPKSDMHHIFPAAVKVNSARGSFPYGEINDNQTNSWYYLTSTLSSIPSNNIDLYSEVIGGKFEPRESVKGNLARAVFYFYTMYKNEADNANPNYFWDQLDDLCEWHYNDPVDSLEWLRTFRIANYQDNQPNPYILDCSLAGRTFCDSVRYACEQFIISDIDEPILEDHLLIYPNPNSGTDIFVEMPTRSSFELLQINIVNMMGKLVYRQTYNTPSKLIHIQPKSILTSGIYMLTIETQNNRYQQKLIVH